MSTATLENKLDRALELVGPIDPEIAETYPSLEARVLAQALENVEQAERRLRGDRPLDKQPHRRNPRQRVQVRRLVHLRHLE